MHVFECWMEAWENPTVKWGGQADSTLRVHSRRLAHVIEALLAGRQEYSYFILKALSKTCFAFHYFFNYDIFVDKRGIIKSNSKNSGLN